MRRPIDNSAKQNHFPDQLYMSCFLSQLAAHDMPLKLSRSLRGCSASQQILLTLLISFSVMVATTEYISFARAPKPMIKNYAPLLLAISLLVACGGSDNPNVGISTTPPVGGAAIAVEPAFTNLTFIRPVAMLQAPGDDSNWFVVEQPGRVLVFENSTDVTTTLPFIDITDRVDDGPNEAGLLGMAFHPDYANNGYVYFYFQEPGV
jgi:hypothetical protein